MPSETRERPAPQIIADGAGSYSPNPSHFGFNWPDIQAVFDRGQRLFERRDALGHEQQDLAAEKQRLEHDLLQAEAGVALAAAGMEDTQIADAATTVDVPKSSKRLAGIEKRLGGIDSDLAALDLAVMRHKGELEQALGVARLDGTHAAEVVAANQADIIEVQELEARVQDLHLRIQARGRLGELVGLPSSSAGLGHLT
jgi:chromosome segregation ATPase